MPYLEVMEITRHLPANARAAQDSEIDPDHQPSAEALDAVDLTALGGSSPTPSVIRLLLSPFITVDGSPDYGGSKCRVDEKPRVQDLRHTCASWMIQSHVPLPVIQEHLGHENITTTIDRYGHIDRRSAQAAADALSACLR